MESGLSPAIAKNYESHLSHGRYEDALVLANALNDKSKRENVRLRMISGADDLFESKKYAEAIGLYDRVLDKFKGDVAALKGKEAARRKLDELEKGRWISLLAFVDPSKDTISGSWTWKDGKLVSDESAFARIEIPYRPPEEFDVRMEFVRQTGRAGVALALSRGGRAFDWVMGASSNAAAGFETISGAIVKENPTRSPGAVENGRAYTVLVEVRKDGLKSFINGQPSAAWKTDYSDLGVYSGWKLRDNGLLGLGSHESSTAFSRLELREVSGKGTAVSRAAAGAPDEWAASIARLPAPEQARRVVAELRKLNPVLEEKEVTFKEKDGVIVELSIESSAIRDLSPVRALKGLELLRSNGAKDPATKKAVAAPLSDLSTLKGLRLKELSVSDTMVQDLSPLEGMPLWALYIFSTPVRDLAPLRGMPLEELYCAQSPISDLSPLSKLPLRILFMNSTAVRTLEPLRGLSLIKLGASWMEISDLSPLANMRLEYLDVEHTPVADLSPVKGMPLQRLWCAGTKVTDLSVIAGMPLKDLECEFVPERDLALLRSITSLERINDMAAAEFWKKFGAPGTELPPEEQVRQVVRKMKELNPEFDGKETHKIEDGQVVHLSISAMGVTNVSPVRALSRLENFQCTGFWNQAKGEIKISDFADLSPLRGLPLRSVNVQRTRVRDLSPLAAMPLAALNCMDTQVGDLTPLAAVPLTHLECYNAPVSDLSPLKGKNMEWLNIDSTQVSDLSPISGMQLAGVLLYNTKVTDLSPLKTIPHLKFLECTYNPMRDREILRSIKTLEKINDMPVAEFWKKQDQK
jgi:Leucine-rich repeat (LRR) protein